jgi:hypothetical protein
MVRDPAIAEHFIAKISGRLTDFVEGFKRVEHMFGEAGERRATAFQGG